MQDSEIFIKNSTWRPVTSSDEHFCHFGVEIFPECCTKGTRGKTQIAQKNVAHWGQCCTLGGCTLGATSVRFNPYPWILKKKFKKTGTELMSFLGKIQTKIQKSNFGNDLERHFWKQNPDLFHEYLVMIFFGRQNFGNCVSVIFGKNPWALKMIVTLLNSNYLKLIISRSFVFLGP